MRFLLVNLIFALFCGCASYDKRNFSGLKAQSENVRFGSSIFVRDRGCPSQLPLGDESVTNENFASAPVGLVPIISAAITSIGSDFLATNVVNSLKANKKGLSGEFIASGIVSTDLFKGGCLVIVRGLHGELNPNISEGYDHLNPRWLKRMNLADYPAFYLELYVKEKGGMLISEPIYLSYASQIGKSKGSGYKFVSAIMAMDNSSHNTSEKIGAATNLFKHDFGRLKVGGSYSNRVLTGTSSARTNPTNLESPVTVSVLVADSEDASVAMESAIESLENKKSDLTSAFEAMLKDVLNVESDNNN